MAESQKAADSEFQMLRDKISELEGELKEVRAESEEVMAKMMDEPAKISRGLVASSLETLAVAADITRSFADRASQLSRSDNRGSATKQLTYLPMDLADAFLDSMEQSIDGAKKVVDKFREEYKK